MTEMAVPQRRKRLSTKTVTLRLAAASLMASAAIGGGLAIQMARGHDPALGTGTSSAQTHASSGSQSVRSSQRPMRTSAWLRVASSRPNTRSAKPAATVRARRVSRWPLGRTRSNTWNM